MPEGPEIRLAADRVARVLLGQVIDEASLRFPAIARFERKIQGRTVTAVDTRGKAMLTRFDNNLTLYSHNQLYGRWYTSRRPRMPKTGRALRVALHTATHSALLYSATDIEVLTDKQLSRHPFLTRLGPDILDPDLKREDIVELLSARPFRNRALGHLYLDQSFLAGNGNYLRSEILWAAGVHPSSKADELDSAALRKTARATLSISRRSYRTRGVTVSPKLAKALKATGMSYQRYRFNVFGRENLPCHRCESRIERHIMGGRNIYVCPACQQPGD